MGDKVRKTWKEWVPVNCKNIEVETKMFYNKSEDKMMRERVITQHCDLKLKEFTKWVPKKRITREELDLIIGEEIEQFFREMKDGKE